MEGESGHHSRNGIPNTPFIAVYPEKHPDIKLCLTPLHKDLAYNEKRASDLYKSVMEDIRATYERWQNESIGLVSR